MASFQVRYWFESNSRERTGEQVIEHMDSESAETAAAEVQKNMRETTFAVVPAFGPAQTAGLVVLNSSQIRYVEIVPVSSDGVPLG